jgi:phage terminase small subunit
MPRRHVPHNLKIIAGTDRPDREIPLVAYDLPAECPPCPDWFAHVDAVTEWNRLAPILHKNKLLTEAGTSALAMLCALHGELVDCFKRRNQPKAAFLAQYRAYINDFGLTPVAQGKVRAQNDDEKPNRFGRKPSAGAG